MMRSTIRFLRGSLPVTVAAAVVLTLGALTALPAAANQEEAMLVFKVPPSTTQVNTAMKPAVVVDVDNASGVPVNSFGGPVTLSIVPNTGSATTDPTVTGNRVNAIKGVATFSDLTFSAADFHVQLQASAQEVNLTSAPPNPQFDIVTQAVQCQPGQTCKTDTVSDAGTSGFAMAGTASTSDVLTATGGGFPALLCTTQSLGGGVVTFTVTNRSKTVTILLTKALTDQGPGPGSSHFNICWGSDQSFPTAGGGTSQPNNGEFEGLLPGCPNPLPVPVSSPCITMQSKTGAGMEDTTIDTPPGDGHGTY